LRIGLDSQAGSKDELADGGREAGKESVKGLSQVKKWSVKGRGQATGEQQLKTYVVSTNDTVDEL
jgi:hypothetical protein